MSGSIAAYWKCLPWFNLKSKVICNPRYMLYRACQNEYGIPCGLRATKDEPVPNWCPMSVRKFVVIKAPHDPGIRGYTDPRENGAPGISAQWVWHIYQTAAQTDNLLRAMNYKPGRQADRRWFMKEPSPPSHRWSTERIKYLSENFTEN